MRPLAFAVLALSVACGAEGGSASDVQQQALSTGAALGASCETTAACAEGLVCEAARGGSLCLPAAWFTGMEGAWCFGNADCGAGLRCDTEQPPHPFVDGACRATSAQ